MKLTAYLEEHDLSDADFGALIGKDRTTVSRIRRGVLMPTPELMRVIMDVTAGAVMPNDHFGIDAKPEGEAA